jgi:hypothetical protein
VTLPTQLTNVGLSSRCNSASRKPTSNGALCAITSAPARNSISSSATAPNSGLSARNSSVKPCTLSASLLLVRCGLT